VTLDRGHERSFLTAYESACSEPYAEVELKIAAEYIFAEHTVFPCLVDGLLKPLNGNRVFSSYVDIALI